MNKINYGNIKELFLLLTEYTIPFGYEHKLEKYLPQGYKRDKVGNYYYEIGESETLFCAHLDSYCDRYKKVSHVQTISENTEYISTDEKTILGADNKAGCVVLLYMIAKKIPGTYFFFLGEEGISTPYGGTWGSKMALRHNPEYFEKFRRAISFDRKEYGSVITRMKARNCCSEQFAEALAYQLTEATQTEFTPDHTGFNTDTGSFMDVISECTNISVGVFHEHTNFEKIDISYLTLLCESIEYVNWEDLPYEREVIGYRKIPMVSVLDTLDKIKNNWRKQYFEEISKLMGRFGMICPDKDFFEIEKRMEFHEYFYDTDWYIKIFRDNKIESGEQTFDTIDSFNQWLELKFTPEIDLAMNGIQEFETQICIQISSVDKSFVYKTVEEYTKHFNNLNSNKTSYVYSNKGEARQWIDIHGNIVSKNKVLLWLAKVLSPRMEAKKADKKVLNHHNKKK